MKYYADTIKISNIIKTMQKLIIVKGLCNDLKIRK